MKKVIFGSIVSLGLLVASQVFAMAYDPATKNAMMNNGSGSLTIQAVEQDPGSMKMYVQNLQQGSLSPAQQMEFYKMMQGQMGVMQPSAMNYQYMASPSLAISNYNRQAAWVGLMIVMTVILVWVVLLLLIALLWHQVKKHKHH